MKHLFLDLEDTVITPVWGGWSSAALINTQLVLDLIKTEKPDRVHLFSFAIHNKRDLVEFQKEVQGFLEKALNITLGLLPNMEDDIIPACARAMGIHPKTVSFQDACEFWSKHQAFRLFVKDRFGLMHSTWKTDTEVILLDDMVMNETWEWPDLRIKGKTIRV